MLRVKEKVSEKVAEKERVREQHKGIGRNPGHNSNALSTTYFHRDSGSSCASLIEGP